MIGREPAALHLQVEVLSCPARRVQGDLLDRERSRAGLQDTKAPVH
jgi:hypothetical protein